MCTGRVGLLVACFIGYLVSTARASDRSYELIVAGSEQMRQGNDAAALEQFKAATVADPADAQAWLFSGTASNQLGRPDQAISALNRAAELNCDNPELLFQLGRARTLLGQYLGAIDALTRFEAAKPGRGQTSEFLGRAYTGVGDYAKADAAFRRAVELNPDLRSTVLPYQANLARLRKDQVAEWQSLDDLRWYAPESATARAVRDDFAAGGRSSLDDFATVSPLKFSVGFTTGYNSDVQGVEVIPIQGNAYGRGSVFDETTLAGSYSWTGLTPTTGPSDALTVSAAALVDNFPQATSGDFVSNNLSAEYQRPLFGPVSGSLRVSGDYDSLHWRGFHDQIQGRAAVQYRIDSRLMTEAAYTGAYDNYFFDSLPLRNPDARADTYSLDLYADLSRRGADPWRAVSARVGGFFVTNRSKGADFDFNGGGVVAGLEFPLIRQVRAQLVYNWTENRYLNPNSLIFLATSRRNDFYNSISFRLSRQMREWDRHLTVFAGYQFSQNTTNVPAYKFSQQIVSLGVNWDI